MIATLLAALPLAPCALPNPAAAVPTAPLVSSNWALGDDADDAYAFIAGLAEKGLHSVVAREAESFLERFPRHARADDVRYALAGARFDQGDLQGSRPLYERLVDRSDFAFPDEARFRLGQCELDRKQLDAAAKAFESVGDGYLRVPALYLAGEAYFQGEKFAEAVERFEAVRLVIGQTRRGDQSKDQAEQGSYGADALHGLAWCALRLGQPDRAVGHAEGFLTQYPSDTRLAELRFLAGEAHRAAGRNTEALAFYRAVERAGAEKQAARWQEASLRGAAFASAAAGAPEDAAQRFGLLLERYPEGKYVAEAAMQRGVNLVLAGEPSAAREALSHGRVEAGATAEYWRGRAALADGDPTSAETHLRQGLGARPTESLRSELASSRGDALFELGRTAEAAASYESAGTPYALHSAAVAHLNDGRSQEAQRLAQRLGELVEAGVAGSANFAVEGQLVLAEALFAQQAYEESEAIFLTVMAAPGEDSRAARALSRAGWCRYLTQDWALAAEHFSGLQRSYPDAPERAEACFLAGRCAEELGQGEAAVSSYDSYVQEFGRAPLRAEALLRAARLVPGEAGEARLVQLVREHAESELAPDAALELGDRCAAAGRLEAAAGAYGFVLEQAPDSGVVHAARYGMGWCRFSAGDGAGALEVLGALAAGAGVPEELALSGLELSVFAARSAQDAAACMRAFAAFAPRCPDELRRVAAAEVVAETLVTAGELEQARGLYAALAGGLQDPAIIARLAVARSYLDLDAGSPDEAEGQLVVALRAEPENTSALEAAFFLGEARFATGDDERAAQAYDLAARSPDGEVQSRALYKAGFARLRQAGLLAASEDQKEAAKAAPLWTRSATDFERLVKDHPRSELYGESLFLAGECAYRSERLEDCASWMTRLLKERSVHATRHKALFRLGLSQAKLERFKRAASTLATLRKDAPEFESIIEAELWRGESLLQIGDMRAARKALERVVSEDRGVLSAHAYLALGRLAQAQDDLDEALSQYLKVAVLYALDAEVAEALFRAGNVLEAKGDLERAIDQYEDAKKRFPKTAYGALASDRLVQISR